MEEHQVDSLENNTVEHCDGTWVLFDTVPIYSPQILYPDTVPGYCAQILYQDTVNRYCTQILYSVTVRRLILKKTNSFQEVHRINSSRFEVKFSLTCKFDSICYCLCSYLSNVSDGHKHENNGYVDYVRFGIS